MALKQQDFASVIFAQLQAQVLNAKPPPQNPTQGLQDLASALSTAIISYLTASLEVTTPDGTKCTVS